MKKIIVLFSLSALLVLGLGLIAINETEANTAQGWEFFQAEFLGSAIGCEPGQARRDFVLVGYNSVTPISDTQGLLIKSQVVNRQGIGWRLVRESAWVSDTNIAPALCYNPAIEAVRVVVQANNQSIYHAYNGAAWWGSTLDSRLKERGTYQRGYAHIQPKSMTPTTELKSPINVFVNTSRPAIAVATNDLSSLYRATALWRTFLGFWRNGERIERYGIFHGGGVGTRLFTPATFADGLYTVTATQQLNGVNDVLNRAPSDTSCGNGLEKLDVQILEKDSLRAANLRGLNPRMLVMNRASGTVAQTISFNSNAITPTFCIDPRIHSVNMSLTVSPSSLYFNSGDVLRGYTQVVVVGGRNYTRINFEIPRRTQPVTRDFTLTAEPVDIKFGSLAANYQKRWSGIPTGTLTTPVDFYVDTTLPTATVTLTGSSTPVESRVNAVVTVRDAGSGMRSFNLVLIPTRSPQNMASVTVPFTVGTGLIGGPKDAQTVRMGLRVLPGTDYQYYVVATDVAGNRYQTPRQTLRTDNVYPDLDANNFRIISTCLPEAVGGDMAAVCPVTRADVRMNNVGGREITAGTRISYRIESQPATGGSWTNVTTGNYVAGLQPGALSTAIPLTLPNLRGGSNLRLAVNLAPQLNASIGEQNFTNNTSAPLRLVFTQAPPTLTLTADRTLVRMNETVSLRWEIDSPYGISCVLQDGDRRQDLVHTSGISNGTVTSQPISNFRTVTLICISSAGVETRASVDISVIPNVQEV